MPEVDENIITREDLARAREIDFVLKFTDSVKKLTEVLGITRMVSKQAGTVIKAYKASGTIDPDTIAVEEGEVIPLSKYQTEEVPLGEMAMLKVRKATTAEAIVDRGYDQAVGMTTERMLKDVAKIIRGMFFSTLSNGDITKLAGSPTLQGALAGCWGKLQVLFEDDEIDSVYFMNPLDVAEYLATANVTTQTAFGMTYIENFLGLGTVILNSSVEQGKVYATAKENLVCYYIAVNGADLNEAFSFTSDETGLIGIHENADYNNLTAIDTVVCGITFFAERIDGIVECDIKSAVVGG